MKPKFAKRVDALQKIVGWYKTEESPLYKGYKASKFRGKFSDYLRKSGITDEVTIKSLSMSANEVNFKISTNYNDILRCSKMFKKKYFESCLAPGGCNEVVPQKYCERESTLGILYVPDKAGHIKARCFIVYNPLTKAYHLLRKYGDTNWMGIKEVLSQKLPHPVVVNMPVLHFKTYYDEGYW